MIFYRTIVTQIISQYYLYRVCLLQLEIITETGEIQENKYTRFGIFIILCYPRFYGLLSNCFSLVFKNKIYHTEEQF